MDIMQTIHSGPEPVPEIPDLDVAAFVLGHARERGTATALLDGASGRAVTYAQLADGVGAVAAGLAARGFGPGDVLGVLLPNVIEYPSVLYGPCAAGGASTTINPLYTVREVVHQLADSRARFLVTTPEFLATARTACEQAGVEELFVIGGVDGATPFDELLGDPAAAPFVTIAPGADVAALPYSSGTTGLSKGVMLTHRNLVADITLAQAALPLTPEDRLIGALPFFHIYGMNIILGQGLRAGAAIVAMTRFDFRQFLELIERHAITQAYVVPPIALALAKEAAVDEHDLSSLATIVSGGAPLGAELAEQVERRIGCDVVQAYGLTETSSMTHTVRRGAVGKHRSIGQPLPGTACRIVDPVTGRDAGVGEPGELWIRGPQVMRGYLGNAAATAGTLDGEGWLHTGDVARVDADGCFEIVDRLKELIKYKGYQVAPAELEAVIGAHPDVLAVAVVGVPDDEAGELPKAFVVPAGDGLDPAALTAWVAERVAPQKRIRLVEIVADIPRSPSGKILRRLLRERS
jgi:acyl-CoA synthetase (AMP-forming)/AMP-acid ligase II